MTAPQNIYRVDPEYSVVVDRDAMLDSDLSYAARGLLAAFCAYPYADPNLDHLVADSPHRDRDAVLGLIRELEDAQLLEFDHGTGCFHLADGSEPNGERTAAPNGFYLDHVTPAATNLDEICNPVLWDWVLNGCRAQPPTDANAT